MVVCYRCTFWKFIDTQTAINKSSSFEAMQSKATWYSTSNFEQFKFSGNLPGLFVGPVMLANNKEIAWWTPDGLRGGSIGRPSPLFRHDTHAHDTKQAVLVRKPWPATLKIVIASPNRLRAHVNQYKHSNAAHSSSTSYIKMTFSMEYQHSIIYACIVCLLVHLSIVVAHRCCAKENNLTLMDFLVICKYGFAERNVSIIIFVYVNYIQGNFHVLYYPSERMGEYGMENG